MVTKHAENPSSAEKKQIPIMPEAEGLFKPQPDHSKLPLSTDGNCINLNFSVGQQ